VAISAGRSLEGQQTKKILGLNSIKKLNGLSVDLGKALQQDQQTAGVSL